MAPNRRVAPKRRDAIVQATIRCLARDGYARLTMKILACEAGVSQGILHYYFADKAEILAAALETVTQAFDARLARAQTACDNHPEARLHAVIQTCLATALDCPDLWRVYVQMWGEMMHDDHLRALNAALYTKMRRQVAALLVTGMRQGVFRRLDANHTAAVIVGLMDGIALQLTFDPNAFPLATATQCCTDAVQRFIAPAAPQA